MLRHLARWSAITLVMASVVYATTIHWLYLPENTLRSPAADLTAATSFDGDAAIYQQQAADLRSAPPPYRYRILPALLARLLGGYLALNVLCALLLGVGTVAWLEWRGDPLALLGGVLAATLPALTSTVLFPMADPLSLVMALALVWSLESDRPLLMAGVAVAGVLTKEVLLVAVPLLLVRRRWLAALAPIAAVVAVRLWLPGPTGGAGGGAGGLPQLSVAARVLDPVDGPRLVVRVALALGALWLGLLRLRGHERRDAAIAVPLVLLAVVAGSSHVVRTLGVLYPWLLPGLLRLAVQRDDRPGLEVRAARGENVDP